ncbi:hypothetical protein AAFF27_15220 [Xylophilus sp. GW821-FHT01B05]
MHSNFTFGGLIDLQVIDMKKCCGPSALQGLHPRCAEDEAGQAEAEGLRARRLIQFGQDRGKEGAGPVTISMGIGYIKLVVSHAAAVHGFAFR